MRMNINRRRAVGAIGMTLLAGGAAPVLAQAPAKLLLGFPAGGSFDAIARMLAGKLQEELNQTIIVDNRPGAGGRLVMNVLKMSPADGSVVMLGPDALAGLYPFTVAKLNYDPDKDLAPIGTVAEFPHCLAVSTRSGIATVAELVDHLRKNPSKALFGTPALAAPPHFYGMQFGQAIGVKFEPVPFQGSAPLNTALMGNQIMMAVDVMASMIENHKANKIRVLAVSTQKRAPQLPDVPTFAEAGFPQMTGASWNALYATGGTPASALAPWSRALAKVMATQEMREKILSLGFLPVGGSPEELTARSVDSAKQWAAAVKATGFVAQ